MKKGYKFFVWVALIAFLALGSVFANHEPTEKVQVAGITTVMRPNSHSDVQLRRLVQGYNLDGTGDQLSHLELASLYTDQVPENDVSRALSNLYGFPIYDTVAGALTLGTGELAVDAVYLALEHGDYPKSPIGSTEYPKRRIFEEVVEVFEESGRVVPVFMDKHLSDNCEDAMWIYNTAQEMNIPMMAGSSLPVARRHPVMDIPRGTEVEEVVGIWVGSPDGHAFHIHEMVQSLVERRAGGATGIKRVRALEGDAVWEAAGEAYDVDLLLAALTRFNQTNRGYYTHEDLEMLQEQVEEPVLFIYEYVDGLKVSLFGLPGFAGEYTVAWRTGDPAQPIQAILPNLQFARPFTHHGVMVQAVQEMFVTGEPVYPVERTLMVSCALDAALTSLNLEGGAWVETPKLTFSYETDWNWEQPAYPAPDREYP